MTTPYANIAQLKKRLNIKPDFTDDDADIQDALDSAAEDVEADTGGRQFYLDDEPSARIFDPHGRVEQTRGGVKLLVDDIGSLDGLLVEVGDPYTDTWTEVTNYLVGPDNALVKNEPIEWLLRRYLPWTFTPTQRVRTTARWGWPVIPKKANQATLIRAQRVYRRKASPEGVAGFNDMGVVRLSKYDADYDKLIAALTTFSFGA